MIPIPQQHRILVVDDEPDVHAVTRLSLKTLRYHDRRVLIDAVGSGREAVAYMREHPDTAVILLDVVMESQTAGLDACQAIRSELGNRFVRILLRTGQPGVAPERKTIDDYDIDGYLSKAELTSHRLYAAVRTALKAFEELIELERHREVLRFVLESTLALRSFEPLETSLTRILEAVTALAPTPLALLHLVTFEQDGNPREILLHVSPDPSGTPAGACSDLAARISRQVAASPGTGELSIEGGLVVPILLHRDLGSGWIYVEGAVDDALGRQALVLLAAHAANALYSTVAEGMLRGREHKPLFEEMAI